MSARRLACGALWLAASLPAAAEPPACLAHVSVAATDAYVGQQIVHRLEILRRSDVESMEWEAPLRFPGFRVERLASLPAVDRTRRAGATYLVFEERRALFPLRAGRLALPEAGLRCRTSSGWEPVRVSGLALSASALPRAATDTLLVGRISLRTRVEPARIRLGETARLVVVLRGGANLWDVPRDALAPKLEGVEIFERPVELEIVPGRELQVRRTLAFDLVPRRTGLLRIPATRVSYFDPGSKRFRDASSSAHEIHVGEADAAAAAPAAPAPATRRSSAPLAVLAGALVLAATAALATRALQRWWRRPEAARRRRLHATLRRELRAADAARRSGDREVEIGALLRALRAGLAERVPHDPRESPAAPATRGEGDSGFRTATGQLAALERARFARNTETVDLDAVRAVLSDLRRSL